MSKPIAARIYWRFLLISFAMVAMVLVAVWVAYDDLETTMLGLDFNEDRGFFLGHIDTHRPTHWQTAALTAVYIPDELHSAIMPPPIFSDRPYPYSAEVDWRGATWLVSIDGTDGGRLYLAKNISRFEQRENLFLVVLAGLFVLVAILIVALARAVVRPLAAPVARLTEAIGGVRPGRRMGRIETNYPDSELVDIAGSVNALLDELESYVERERSLLSLASHELRTPIAVISGAVDVLANRTSLGDAERRTLARIGRSTAEMQRNISALLQLSRGRDRPDDIEPVAMDALVAECVDDCHAIDARAGQRIETTSGAAGVTVTTSRAMAKMLLRNLLQNALQHTDGTIRVALSPAGIELRDSGVGLPADKQRLLQTVGAGGDRLPPVSGLGLFIVTLLCERLGWQLDVVGLPAGGTLLRVHFATPASAEGDEADD